MNNEKSILDRSLSRRADLEHTGWIDYVSWLSDDILLMVGWFHAPAGQPIEACLVQHDKVVPLEVRCISYPLPKIPGDTTGDPSAGKVLTVRFLRPGDTQKENLGRLVISTGASTFSPCPFDLSAAVDLRTLLESRLMLLEWQTPDLMLEFLTATVRRHLGTTNIIRLSHSVSIIRDSLRERLPSVPVTPEQPRNVWVDHLLAINETSFYIRGWVSDPDAKIEQLSIISPEGSLTDITKNAFYFPRPELHQFFNTPADVRGTPVTGMLGYFTTDSPSFVSSGWIAQMKNTAGHSVETLLVPVVRDYSTIKDVILGDVAALNADKKLLYDHVIPALSQLQRERQREIEIEHIEQYGRPPASPEVSIIVPLYRRVDFLEHQLAQFVNDAEIRKTDLIYVLDSPELGDGLLQLASHLFQLYQVPFRLVILNGNFGYSAANNVGAAIAHGRLLLLLNSDILPSKPGWLGKLVSFYDSMPGIGALGPKLLFEDDTLQHAGLFFERLENTSLWTNQHYYKGYHRDLPAANKPRSVPGVTGACMMVSTNLYRSLGGLGGTYIQGDYEDSDFCLKLLESGRKNWYLPQVELYHLEGQSYPAPLRLMGRKFNAWVQTQLWGDLIDEVMSRYPGRFESATADDTEMTPVHFAEKHSSKRRSQFADDPARLTKPGLIRTRRSDLVNLYLQTCTRSSGPENQADSPVWVMSESGSMIVCS